MYSRLLGAWGAFTLYMLERYSSLSCRTSRIILLDIRTFSFSQRTVNEWNRLSADCVGASSVNIFKKKRHIPKKGGVYLDR